MMRLTEEQLLKTLHQYLYWRADGSPKHGNSYIRDKEERRQYYYDPYHDHIREIEPGIYGFRVQLDDSPEGDYWVTGKFKLEHGRVTILEQTGYIN